MGRKGRKRRPSPPLEEAPAPPGPPEWMQQQAQRFDAFGDFLNLSEHREYWQEQDLADYQERRRQAALSGDVDPETNFPPPKRIGRLGDAVTRDQEMAWREDWVWPQSEGLRPAGQPRTPKEEIHRLVAGTCVALNFCPSDRAVMVCGRPVVVPEECLMPVAYFFQFVACFCED